MHSYLHAGRTQRLPSPCFPAIFWIAARLAARSGKPKTGETNPQSASVARTYSNPSSFVAFFVPAGQLCGIALLVQSESGKDSPRTFRKLRFNPEEVRSSGPCDLSVRINAGAQTGSSNQEFVALLCWRYALSRRDSCAIGEIEHERRDFKWQLFTLGCCTHRLRFQHLQSIGPGVKLNTSAEWERYRDVRIWIPIGRCCRRCPRGNHPPGWDSVAEARTDQVWDLIGATLQGM